MHIQNLSVEEFTNFQKNHPLSNLYQTVNYGMLQAENEFDYDLIGLVDYNGNILAASLILIKQIAMNAYYGYAPRGFLIDYSNEILVNTFTECLVKYYQEKNVAFIKVNPNLPIGKINTKTFETEYNENKNITTTLIRNNYKKLVDNLYFEAQLPRFNAFINLKNYNLKNLNKNTKNKIRKGMRKGLECQIYSKNEIMDFYNILKKKDSSHNEFYFQDIYTVYEKNDDIDLFLVKINYNEFLKNSQYVYDIEAEKNNKFNAKLALPNNEKIINAKMNSDKILLNYKNDIMEATKGVSENKNVIIAGALVIKHNNMATILYSAYDNDYKRFAPNYFLYYSIIKHYRDNFDILDMNGITGDFTKNNPYAGLNNFKLGFNPQVFEYIGEFDLIINPKIYDFLLRKGILAKTFNKNN